MKSIRFNIFLAALALLAVFSGLFSSTLPTKAAFGTSPPWVKNEHMLPGTTFDQTVNLSRNEAGEAVRVDTRITGDEKLVEWISIENEEELLMQEGQTILPMRVSIDVPRRAEIREYKGNIFVTLAPVEDEGAGGGNVAITLGANIAVQLNVVGEKITDYRIDSAALPALKEGDSFSVILVVENLGNTKIKGIEGQVNIYDKDQKEVLESFAFVPFKEAVPPNETKVSKMTFKKTELEAGEYWVFIEAEKDGQIDYENRLQQMVREKTKPGLPQIKEEAEKESASTETEESQIDLAHSDETIDLELKEVAAERDPNRIYIIFGLAGLAMGLAGIIGLIVVITLLRKQSKTNSSHK